MQLLSDIRRRRGITESVRCVYMCVHVCACALTYIKTVITIHIYILTHFFNHKVSEVSVYPGTWCQSTCVRRKFLCWKIHCKTDVSQVVIQQSQILSLSLWQRGLPSSLYSTIHNTPDKKITKQRGLREEWAASWFESIVNVYASYAFPHNIILSSHCMKHTFTSTLWEKYPLTTYKI